MEDWVLSLGEELIDEIRRTNVQDPDVAEFDSIVLLPDAIRVTYVPLGGGRYSWGARGLGVEIRGSTVLADGAESSHNERGVPVRDMDPVDAATDIRVLVIGEPKGVSSYTEPDEDGIRWLRRGIMGDPFP